MIATMPNGTQAKINQAQADGGVKEAQARVIAQFLGIPGFDRYVILRIDATRAFVNASAASTSTSNRRTACKYKTNCTGESLDYDDTLGPPAHPSQGRPAASRRRSSRSLHALSPRLVQRSVPHHAPAAECCTRWPTRLKGDRVNTFLHLGDLLAVFRKYVQTDFSDHELLSLANHYQGISPDVDRQRSGAVHRRRRSAGLRRFARARRRRAATRWSRTMLTRPRCRGFARRDRASRDSRPRRCASTSKTAAALPVPRGALPICSSTPALPSGKSPMRIAPTTARPRSTNIRR